VSQQKLAEEACEIEMELLKKPIGKQDQYMAAVGGLTILDIAKNGTVDVQPLPLPIEQLEELENNIMLFYTGCVRDASAILSQQDSATKKKDTAVVGALTEIKDIGMEIASSIEKGNLGRFGELMDYHWRLKKQLSKGVTSPRIDALYDLAKQNGAIGGKISGAGGGGFLMLYCEKGRNQLREALTRAGLRELSFRFDFEGSKVMLDITSRDGRLAHTYREVARKKAKGNASQGG
jgi:D-glycero-alpha-D-manno-heptose-7-phosphate kinase